MRSSGKYLFASEGLVELAGYVTPGTLFAFDLDGTLAPIVEDYSDARVSEPVQTTMQRLTKLAKVAVITGRSRKDALRILGFEPHIVIGNHGAEWPDDAPLHNELHVRPNVLWLDQLHEQLTGVDGIKIEFKGESVSVHYRRALDKESALARINEAVATLDPRPRRIGGKCVVNLLPMEAFTKGIALVAAMNLLGTERAIYFGDDETDEEVFSLSHTNIFGIHVGKTAETSARYYINSDTELLGLINSMVGIVEMA